eukprot:gene8061-12523_t
MRFLVSSEGDLKKVIVKTDNCLIYLPEIDLEIQPNDLDEEIIEDMLKQLQKNLKFSNFMGTIGEDFKVRGENYSEKKKMDVSSVLKKMISGEEPFSIVLKDETGNSFIEGLEGQKIEKFKTIKEEELEIDSRKTLLDSKYSNELIQKAFEKFWRNEFIGIRKKDEYKYFTYQEVYQRVCNFSAGLRKLTPRRGFVGIFAETCLEWFISDLACQLCSFVVVPIHTGVDEEQLKSIMITTKISTIICDQSRIEKLKLIQSDLCNLKQIIEINGKWDNSFNSVENMSGIVKTVELEKLNPDEIVSLVYTSGSSGIPKGVIQTEYMWLETLKKNKSDDIENIYVSFAPLSHLTARMKYLRCLMIGGKIGLANPDNLFEDVKLIQPTSFVAPPRIFNFIYQKFQEDLSQNTDEDQLKEKYSKMLGNKLRRIVVGGSKISSHIQKFMEDLFSLPVFDTYGTSETMGIMHNNKPLPNVKLLLKSVLHLGYHTDDKPNPRGEILIKSKMITPGYYGISQKMDIDENGYYSTGDIGEMLENGEVMIIDRKTNFFKLQNSEWITPERIENLIITISGIKQVFVFPNNEKTALFCILVTNLQKSNDCLLKEVKQMLKEKSLASYEIPDFLIQTTVGFTVKNELLTPSLKLRRPKLIKYFEKEIQQMNDGFEEINKNTKKILTESISNLVDFSPNNVKTFQQLGGDSLSAVKLINIIEKKFQVKVSSQEIFDQKFFQILMDKIQGKDVKKDEINYQLPEEIQSLKKDPIENNEIFLTGSTGFLGEFLLNELINEGFSVHCLIRKNKRSETFVKKYTNYKNVHFVFGDLGQKKMGLDSEIYENLTKTISKIYHCGAFVNHLFPYSMLKQVNVDGTIELLKFSVTNEMKHFNYISSTSVFSGISEPITEDYDLSKLKGKAKGGYSTSKFVAEYLVQEARNRKLPITIFRPGMITASSLNGHCNEEDWITALIRTFISYSDAPIQKGILEMCPIDFISKFIIKVSMLETYKNYNLVHPNVGMDFETLIQYIKEAGFEVNCQKNYETWYNEMKRKDEANNKIFKLLPNFSKGIPLRDDFQQLELLLQN